MKDNQTLQKAISILDEVLQPGMTEFEKEKAIYDYMVAYGQYDMNTYREMKGWELLDFFPPPNPRAHSAAGALVDGLAVCDGWSYAYRMLFTMAGLESKVHIGTLYGEDHAWVSVKIDGEWYHIEATTKLSKPSYRKFNFTYEDGIHYLGYVGGNRDAVSRKYDEMNGMDELRKTLDERRNNRQQQEQVTEDYNPYLDALSE